MQVVSARDFRANQTKILTAARDGQSVMLTSRVGNFKIVPITSDATLTERICRGLEEVKLMETGKMPRKSMEDFLNEF